MRFILYILFFSYGMASLAQGQSTLVFNKLTHDFGLIKEIDGKQIYRFEFTNTGKTPILINNVEASCGCTSGEWTKSPVLPNKKGYISVAFDPRNRPGNFSKTLSIYSNTKPKIQNLKIFGKVVPKTRTILDEYPFEMPSGLRLQYDKIAFMKVNHGKSKRLEVKFLNNGDRTINLSFKNLTKEIRLISLTKNVKPVKEGSFILEFSSNKKMLLGLREMNVVIGLDGVEENIPVSADLREDYSTLSQAELQASPRIKLDKKVFKFSDVQCDGLISRNITVSNRGESVLIINRIYSNAKFTYLMSSYKLSPGESSNLSITIKDSDFKGNKNIILRIISNDPRKQEIKLRFIRNIKD